MATRKKQDDTKKRTNHDAEIARERRRLQTVLDTVPSGIIVTEGPDMRIAFMNRRSQEFFRVRPEVGEPLPSYLANSKLMHPDGTPFAEEDLPIHRSLRTGEVVCGEELIIETEDGQRSYLLLGSAPLYDEHGRIFGAVASTEDITPLRKAEEALRQAYARERRISETLQQALLPAVPERIDGLRIASTYIAAVEEAQIGGDFYDVFTPGPDLVGLVIGDVAGKGVQAAVHTALTRQGLKAYAYMDPSPAYVMEKLNSLVLKETPPEFFVTLFYGLLNLRERSLYYANAGHESPLYVDSIGRRVVELQNTGVPLGITPSAGCEQQETRMEDCSKLVMYTDGVTEARSNGTHFGLERLKQCLLAHLDSPPDRLIAELVEQLQGFSGRHLRDDVALLVVELEPKDNNKHDSNDC
ncbi:MAG: SpoIIE family protein phosphatase [Armatimonadota bacterium]|nr:SpoIIE family protein phosphatase [Armatimonadota bacterium]